MFTLCHLNEIVLSGLIFIYLWLGTVCANRTPGYLHTFHTKIHVSSCKNVRQKFNNRFEILLKVCAFSIKLTLFLHLYKTSFFLQLSPILNRMQIQHWLFLSGFKYFEQKLFAFKTLIFVLKTFKMPRKAELLVICFHPHALITFNFQKVILIQPLLIEETSNFFCNFHHLLFVN